MVFFGGQSIRFNCKKAFLLFEKSTFGTYIAGYLGIEVIDPLKKTVGLLKGMEFPGMAMAQFLVGRMNGGEKIKDLKTIEKLYELQRIVYGRIYRGEIEGKVIIAAKDLKDSYFGGGIWEKRAFYDSVLKQDAHWFQKVADKTVRDKIKFINLP